MSSQPPPSALVKPESAVAVNGITDPHKIYLKRVPSPEALDEDNYIDAVSDIIERDFFPGLKRLKLQNEFLGAVQSADLARAKALGMELHRMATGAPGTPGGHRSNTPRMETPTVTGFTPYAESNASETPKMNTSIKRKALDTSLSLDAFQTKYTSEDNASFSMILKKQNEEKKQKYYWYFEKETGRMRLENGDGAKSGKSVGLLEGGSLETKSIETWKFKAKNDLMYHVDGAAQTLGDLKEQKGPPKSISHNATRFAPTYTTKDVMQASREAAERLQTQEVWREMAKATPALFPSGSETPDAARINGFSLVPSTPSGSDHSGVGPAFSIAPTPKREQLLERLAEQASKSLRKRATGTTFAKPLTPARPGTGHATPRRSDLTPKRTAHTPLRAGTPLSKAAQDLLVKSKGSGSNLLAMAAARGFGGDAQLRASYSSPAIGVRRPSSSVGGTPKATPKGTPMAVKVGRGATPLQNPKAASEAVVKVNGQPGKTVPTFEELLERTKQGELITDDLLNF
ncbi:nuclear protein Es2-domain-containing protein [Chytridium lagenaria]|nr:nuclear protein Es2-domain-containing protein [Chytridium lagenaria]